MPWPRVVAESLRRAGRPILPATARWTTAPTRAVLRAIETAGAPARCTDTPPAFLLGHQHDAWRRAIATLEAWPGALLAERVGSGKTWIALGVAARYRRPAVALVPAILQMQWRAAATRAGVPLTVATHERASRGGVPAGNPALVIIDEAHRFRDIATRRTQTIAPWLVGRRTLLLTATPIVNRLADLIALLRLVLPEDALALDGIARLGDLEEAPYPPASLRRVVIRSEVAVATMPRRLVRLAADVREQQRAQIAVTAIKQLTLSRATATRRLIATVLLDAAMSSDAALIDALRRYRALLLQARDAGGASRSMVRAFAGASLDQLVMWPLMSIGADHGELPLEDIGRVETLVAEWTVSDRSWIAQLAARCGDTLPTVCFTRHRATARALRTALGDAAAWVTGSGAGIGPHHVPRDMVLAAFGPGRREWHGRRVAPRVLVATDVAAEGLDLQSAGRILHVDLPWTATRMDQREGRLLRLGQQHQQVEVVVRMPAPAIEIALAPLARIARKRRLADDWIDTLGIDGDAHPADHPAPLMAAVADGGTQAQLVAVTVRRGSRCGVMVLARDVGAEWTADRTRVASLWSRADAACEGVGALPDDVADLDDALRTAALLATCADPPAAAALVPRIHRLARDAAARRDASRLRQLDRLLRFVAAPPTSGARMLLARLADADDRAFLAWDVPDTPAPVPAQVAPISAVMLRGAIDGAVPTSISVRSASRYVAACPDSRPSSSISTER